MGEIRTRSSIVGFGSGGYPQQTVVCERDGQMYSFDFCLGVLPKSGNGLFTLWLVHTQIGRAHV